MPPITRLPANLPKLLRDQGLDVVELPGWQTRGRPASTGGFAPVGVLWHHTGGTPDGRDYVDWMALTGRADLPAPLSQGAINRRGTVFLCAAGRANHAGAAKASGSVAAGDGNRLYVGFECLNTGSEGFDKDQYDAMVTTGAVMMDVLGTSEEAQRAHRETSVTGKWDPGMVNMPDFRDDIRRANLAMHKQPDPVATYPRAERLLTELDDVLRRLAQAEKGGAELRAVLAQHPELVPAARKLRRGVRALIGDDQ